MPTIIYKYNYVDNAACLLDDTVITEQSGYYTMERIVTAMTMAGQRLDEYRLGLLDSDDEDGQDPSPYYMSDPVDIADALSRNAVRRDTAPNATPNVETNGATNDAPNVATNNVVDKSSDLSSNTNKEA